MQCSDARTLANRENAKKSTGPRTEAGKARSRTNAFQHGLAGKGVAWPGELEGEMARFVEGQVAAEPVPPADAKEAQLVERIAMITWQVDRAERAEEAQVVIRASRARAVEEERRDEEVARLVAMIDDDPARAVRSLLRTGEGCRWVVDSLGQLLDAVGADSWTASLDARLEALCAPAQPRRLRLSRAGALARAIWGEDPGAVSPGGIPGLEELPADAGPEARRDREVRRAAILREIRPTWLAELKAILEDRLAEVELRLEELDAQPDPALALAGLASTFDPSEEAERLRRYVRARERERRKLIAELDLHRLQRQENPPQPEPAVEPSPATPLPPAPAPARSDSSQVTSPSHVPPQWVRSAPLECGSRASAFDREDPKEKLRV